MISCFNRIEIIIAQERFCLSTKIQMNSKFESLKVFEVSVKINVADSHSRFVPHAHVLSGNCNLLYIFFTALKTDDFLLCRRCLFSVCCN